MKIDNLHLARLRRLRAIQAKTKLQRRVAALIPVDDKLLSQLDQTSERHVYSSQPSSATHTPMVA